MRTASGEIDVNVYVLSDDMEKDISGSMPCEADDLAASGGGCNNHGIGI